MAGDWRELIQKIEALGLRVTAVDPKTGEIRSRVPEELL